MRKYLFRGKCGNKWHYGDLYTQSNTPQIIAYNKKYDKMDTAFVDPETVGQYTGIADKNGKRIFEGDILKTIFGVGYVVYGIGCFSVQYEPTNCPAIDIVVNDSDVFVIGNIHDNKEILDAE